MENSATGNLSKTGQALADKAADAAQNGVRIAQDTAKDAREFLSSKLEDTSSKARTIVDRGSKRAQAASQQGLDAVAGMAGQAKDVASEAYDSILAYAKKNPVKALVIAAASGAVLYAMIKAQRSWRE